jgi:site-specific DNA-methyltransferase (adenine-specific)
MVSIRKGTQDNKADTFLFVPEIDLSKKWTDESLYKLFDINDQEIMYIESMIREMNFTSD